jgi:glycosyltransferase involved in cell wall biosynthesis
MRIFYVIPATICCGGIRIVYEHANRLKKLGHDVFLYSTDKKMTQDWFDGLEVPFVWEIDRPDVVIATFWKTVYDIERMNLNCRKFYLVQGLEPYFNKSKADEQLVRQTYKMGYKLIAIGKSVQDWLRDEIKEGSYYIKNCVDFKQFHRDEWVVRLKKMRTTILIEGNSDFYYKNIYQGMLALQKFRDKCDIWYLAWNGTGINSRLYDRLISKPPQETLRTIYSTADIFFKPTLLEGASLPIIEAMACGTPVVTTDIPSAHEYCVHGENSRLCERASVEDYERNIWELLKDPEERRRIGKAGFETIKKECDWEREIKKLETILWQK